MSDEIPIAPMDGAEYARALELLGLDQSAAAHFLGVLPRQSRRWIAGDAPLPQAVALLLRVMALRRLDIANVSGLAGKPLARRLRIPKVKE